MNNMTENDGNERSKSAVLEKLQNDISKNEVLRFADVIREWPYEIIKEIGYVLIMLSFVNSETMCGYDVSSLEYYDWRRKR